MKKDAKLDFRYVVQFGEVEVAFPGFKDVFDPPPQAIEGQEFLEGYRGIGNGGQEYRPGHQLE
jgi:hypothetical protein